MQPIRAMPRWIGLVLIVVTVRPLLAAPPEEPEKPKPKITISKETTYITEPLGPDGYPDYVAALNQRMSDGVTPENNAAVLLVKAFGPGIIQKGIRPEVLKQLGLRELPETGDYFVPASEMSKRWREEKQNGIEDSDDSLKKQFKEAVSRPWSAGEFPVVAEWLRANERSLALIREAISRPKYYFPCIQSNDDAPSLATTVWPLEVPAERAFSLLAVHAMQMAELKKFDIALEDQMACHRLARLLAQGFEEGEIGIASGLEIRTTRNDALLAHLTRMSSKSASDTAANITALGPTISTLERVLFCERHGFHDSVAFAARSGRYTSIQMMLYLSDNARTKPGEKAPELGQDDMALNSVDWDIAAMTGSQWFERLAEITQIDDCRTERRAVSKLRDDLDLLYADTKALHPFGWMYFFTNCRSREESGRAAGSIFVDARLPTLTLCFDIKHRANLAWRMDQSVFALVAYRADHGEYPESLQQLVPKYIAAIPDDTSADKPTPIRYRREGEAYVAWSVGLNGIDDNGRGPNDDPPGDDWVLRPVPVKRSDKK